MTTIRPEHASVWSAYADALRPPPPLTPSEFAEKHRVLHAIYCTDNPGQWSNQTFPYQADVMNLIQEAIEKGKRGVVFMKAAQIGGTDAMINAMLWAKVYFPGPQLFLTSTDDVAGEFGRERFDLIIQDMEPLRKKCIPSRRGEILVKRFVDGKIVLCGGQSVNKLQSNPYRFVVIDELDSLVENLGGSGDPVKLAQKRTDSFAGEKLLIAYAHPSTKDRGAGKLYYKHSDQRRDFVTHKCGHEFWMDWFNPDVIVCKPRLPEQTQEHAAKDPQCYRLHCPGCHAEISDSEFSAMIRSGVRQKSILPPEEAEAKEWIGGHASQLTTPWKSILEIAEEYVAALGDENAMMVFVNKTLGDVFEPKVKSVDANALRSLIVVKRRRDDPEFYSRGQVPPGVLFLTGGQDSRQQAFHWTVWGWGIREAIDKTKTLCGWLIDYGEIERTKSIVFSDAEYHIFDDLIYRRRFPSASGERAFMVRACAHDIGYQPTQIPIIRFARSWPGRAFPVRGAAETATSASKADYVRTGTAKRFKVGDIETIDDPALIMNTYLLKTNWFSMVDQRIEIADLHEGQRIGSHKVAPLALPEDCTDLWLEQSKNEELRKGKRSNELVWKATGANHIADCNVYAYALALHFDPFTHNLTAEEFEQQRQSRRPMPRPQSQRQTRPTIGDDPTLG